MITESKIKIKKDLIILLPSLISTLFLKLKMNGLTNPKIKMGMELIKNLNQILVLIKIKKTNERRIKNNP
ncbi:unnamed protein product [marine sediment metagenome]|uniref:Uncharacterized protein n=1 Tax=marine sediment metagenome TaxID=412755 RepID=X1MQ07_9ZZZZ